MGQSFEALAYYDSCSYKQWRRQTGLCTQCEHCVRSEDSSSKLLDPGSVDIANPGRLSRHCGVAAALWPLVLSI